MTWPGENKAWNLLSELNPEEVQKNANIIYDKTLSTYELICFGQQIRISQPDRNISGTSDIGSILINKLGDYSRLSILNYMVSAKEIPLAKQLVRPSDLPGGDIFARGTHVLPLDELSNIFNNHKDSFKAKGESLGASVADYGDMSIELFPFPRVPVVLIVWSGDEEFPAKSSLLFDSSCSFHMSTDILWSTAMLTVQMMMYLGNY